MTIGVVVNPAAGGGRLGQIWPTLAAALEHALGPLSVLRTTKPGEGRHLAERHLRNGAELVISAGGDGTTNEVVDGLLGAGGGPHLGVISVGTGRDFIRTLGDSNDVRAAVNAIASGRRKVVDAGRVSYLTDAGTTQTRHFLNVASIGVSGPTARAVNAAKHGRPVHAKAAFYFHTIVELMRFRSQPVRVIFDSGESIEVTTALVVAANGRYFGGGMMIAPEARIDDGLFDALVYRAEGKLRMVLDFNKIYRGAHTTLPRVTIKRCRRFTVEPLGEPLILEADGESPGRIPATCEILPKALVLRG